MLYFGNQPVNHLSFELQGKTRQNCFTVRARKTMNGSGTGADCKTGIGMMSDADSARKEHREQWNR
jgi:hypothetical protein